MSLARGSVQADITGGDLQPQILRTQGGVLLLQGEPHLAASG
jgi:hypothetical protein